MEFGVLGSLKLRHAGGEVTLGSRRQRRLLAALLVRAGTVVSQDQLIAAVWGDDPPGSAPASLHTYVSRLRRLLHADGAEVLATRPPGYLLQIRPEQTDAGRFEKLVAHAGALGPEDAEPALARLDEALALWRGAAYAEFADDDFTRAEATRLEELRLAAIEARFDRGLALGRHGQLVGAIEAHAAGHPLRERPRAQLMLALYRCGRHAEALAAFREFRLRLDEELGVEPSAALRDLETAILRQSPELDSKAPPSSAPAPASVRSQGVPPAEVSSLVGREQDVTAIAATLDEGRLLTLTGVGGVGKTRLALHAAHHMADRFPDGVLWCELAPVSDGSAAAHALATTVGARQQPGRDVRESIADALAARRVLLMVDNCEHVLDEVPVLLADVAQSCPHVTMLATSRVALGVPGERVRPTAPLPVPPPGAGAAAADSPAVRLFVERARAVRPGLDAGDENLSRIAELCRQLDGLPLAIELAAARIRSLNPADLLARSDDRFGLLTTARPTVAPRHRTLRAVIDWSYALLSPAEQHLFARLSVFAGGFTLEAAERVCPEPALLDLLTALVDSSLVSAGSTAGQVRYAMLETPRAYGRELLESRGEARDVRGAHARYYADLAETAGHHLRGPDEAHWITTVDADLDNLRVAHRWAVDQQDTDLALRLSAGLYHYALYQFRDEVVSWGETALALPGADAHPLCPAVCGAVGEGLTLRGEQSRARTLAERALARIADPRDRRRAPLLKVLSAVSLYEGRLGDCLARAEEMLWLARLHEDSWYECEALMFTGLARTYAGDPACGLAAADEYLRAVSAIGNPTLMAWAIYTQAEALAHTDPLRARQQYEHAISVAESVNSTFAANVAQVGLAALLMRSGETADALRAFRHSVSGWHRMQVRHHQWTTLRNLLRLLTRIGAHQQAATLLGALGAADTTAFGADADGMRESADLLREALGPGRLATAIHSGATLSGNATVAFALDTIDGILSAHPEPVQGMNCENVGHDGSAFAT